MKVANSLEFLTEDCDLPTSGDKIVARYFDSWYVGEVTKDAIGLSGTPGLCIFGRP